MKRNIKLDLIDGLIVLFVAIIIYWICYNFMRKITNPPVFKIEVPKDSVFTSLDTLFSEKKMIDFMYILDMEYPEIVINQARLETGHYTALRFKKYNALFGFQTSNVNIIKYKSWKESVIAYRNLQIKKLRDGENYYDFLIRIKYAEDSLYIKKLKSM